MVLHSNRGKWIGVFGICFAMFLGALDFSIVNTALPTIQEYFSAPISQLQWVMDALGISLAVFIVTMGRLADIFGRKKVFLCGQLLFALASLLCGLAPAMIWLIIGRGLQGIAAAVLIPVSLGLIIHQFKTEEKAKAVGIWSITVGIGMAAGPVIGGLIVSFFNWHWIFLINIPLVVLSGVCIVATVSESKDSVHRAKIDWIGLFLLIIATACLVLPIVEGPTWGWTAPVILILFALAILGFVTLALVERRAAAPILPFSLFFNRLFFSCAISNFVMIFIWWGTFFFLPLYLDNIRGEAPFVAGLVLIALAAPFSISSYAMGRLLTRNGPKLWILFGFFLMALAQLGMSFYTAHTSIIWVIFGLALTGFSFGMMWTPSTTFALASLPKRLSSTASGALGTFQEVGGTVGVAVCGSLFRIVDDAVVHPALRDSGVRLSAEQESFVRSYLSDPNAIVAGLQNVTSTTHQALIDLFRTGFLTGFQATLWLLCGLSLFAFIIVAIVMKGGKQTVVHAEDIMEDQALDFYP